MYFGMSRWRSSKDITRNPDVEGLSVYGSYMAAPHDPIAPVELNETWIEAGYIEYR
jgi:hypothetical protein